VYRLPFQLLIGQRGYAPVGRLGVEPSHTALSGRPRRPAGSRPAEGGSVDLPGVTPLGCSKPAAAPAAHLPRRRATDSNRYARALIRIRSGARGPGGFTPHFGSPARCVSGGRWRKTGELNASASAPTRFPDGDHHLVMSSSTTRKVADLNGTVSPAHPLATEPGAPVRFTFRKSGGQGHANRAVRAEWHDHDFPASLRAPGGSRTRTPRWAPVPGTGVSTVSPPAHMPAIAGRVTDRIRTGPLTLARSDAYR
jgi:hypothetical protein